MDLEQARKNMIEQQIRPWDVLDVDILNLYQDIPRELFVPDQYKNLAFSDLEIPLQHEQVMMSPKVEARMLQSLQISPSDNILEIGTGTGFITACLAKLGNQVETIEYYSDLAINAQSALERQSITNINCTIGDATTELNYKMQFEVIAVTASMPVYIDFFEHLLAKGGRIFVIVGKAPVMQAQLITRVGPDGRSITKLFETNLRPLVGIKEPQVFKL